MPQVTVRKSLNTIGWSAVDRWSVHFDAAVAAKGEMCMSTVPGTDGPLVLMSDPRIAAVAVGDSGEPVVDLREVPELWLDGRQADECGAYARLREAVVHRLLDAQATLPRGMRFLITEGYRPLELQRSVFDGYRDELRRLHEDWSEERLFVEASKFASPVAVAPHSTGGAVDLTLCTEDGVELDMGTAVDATPEASANACFTAARGIPELAWANRRILALALERAGLVNYPTEWWHWSFGDRYWAFVTGTGKSRYGPVELPAADAAAS
jgi:D-alanyl-D-alanine dipeptidase